MPVINKEGSINVGTNIDTYKRKYELKEERRVGEDENENENDSDNEDEQDTYVFGVKDFAKVHKSVPSLLSAQTPLSKDCEIQLLKGLDLSSAKLNPEEEKLLRELILKYSDLFASKPGRTNITKHHIDVGDARPIKLPPYRILPPKRDYITQELVHMKEQNIIEPATGPWVAPVTLQPKRDGTMRFCIDYRRLNEVTVRDVYPLPRIDDTLDALYDAKYFSTLDLRSGFWQVELDEESKEKTAFVTHDGLVQFTVMPFGLTNAPATFQRLMDVILSGLKWRCCLVYLDDVIIFSSTFDQHLKDINDVLGRLRQSNLTLKASKCHFCHRELKYLGHIVSAQGIRPDPEKLKAVRDFPVPYKAKGVRSFLGLTGYYRRFIQNYATIAEPLLQLIRVKRSPVFVWIPECQDSFDELKQNLITSPIISYSDFNHPFILQLDASDYGLGAVLAQKGSPDGEEHVIAYASRTLNESERKYSATERECLAIVWGTQHFRPYLEGRSFEVWTDHRSLTWLRRLKDPTSRRWGMKLDAFDMIVKHRSGAANQNADALSRYPTEVVSPLQMENTNAKHELNKNGSTEQEVDINVWNSCNVLDDIKQAQRTDRELQPLIDYLHDGILPSDENISKRMRGIAKYYKLIDGRLYGLRRFDEKHSDRFNYNQHLLVIPKSKIQNLLYFAHDHAVSGHFGKRKTLHRLYSRFHWQGMRKDVENYIHSCDTCQRCKATTQKLAGKMISNVVHEPWYTIGIDITGPLPRTKRGNEYILVVVDYFTKWVELFPSPNTRSISIAQILHDEVIRRFGCPVKIISDNGSQFVSEIFEETLRLLQIEHRRTALYHPQTKSIRAD
ncbi:unnamed protein product [Didymodactylos carnosus]|uniref:Uncharacterized protein n=1 Tax=Didymodactylos carnosus TaxID=1234261 RepID=A0A814V730_9BILA|nr:unnamed protein product [Didymodactylos carnosus]CAF3947737.1 unnamed protein product [Didymodactylos carnosus]